LRLGDFPRKEIESSELLRALAVIGPLMIAYFFLREPAVLNLGLIASDRQAETKGRRFFIALAASFAGRANGIAEERVANVIIGGVFGLIAVALMEFVWRRVGAGKAGCRIRARTDLSAQKS
jgi:hypothetical protein